MPGWNNTSAAGTTFGHNPHGKLGAVAVVNPYWAFKDDYYYNLQLPYLGEKRAEQEYPIKSLIKAGVVISTASDYPVTTPPNPFYAIEIGITRTVNDGDMLYGQKTSDDPKYKLPLWPEESATLGEMIKSCTLNAAYTYFMENTTGSITVGKSADLIVLDQNLFKIDVNKIHNIKILENYFKGKLVYKSEKWLAQYDLSEKGRLTYEQRMEHFKSFITSRDVEQIAKWGADHIRLPINGELLLEENSEEYFYYIDQCIQWCEDCGINIIIDIHQIEGHEYGQMQKVIPLLMEEKLQQGLIEVWKRIAYRYATKQKPVIMFEVLNESSDASKGYLWNRLYKEIVKEIQSIDKNHYILVGSNDQNSVFELNSLELMKEDRILYNFHFYEPQIFTHQKAHFSEDMLKYNCKVHYPDTINDFLDFLSDNPKYLDKYRWFALEKDINKKLLEKVLVDAKTFCEYSGCNLYCSEFGVINNAD